MKTSTFSINVAKRLPADAFSKNRGAYLFRVKIEDVTEAEARRVMSAMMAEFPDAEYLLTLRQTETTVTTTYIAQSYED